MPILQNTPIRNRDESWTKNNLQKFAKHLKRTLKPSKNVNIFAWENFIQEKVK